MSTVVNGHRDEDTTTHNRPHGHILPMLSFSASTPTEEDNPLDSNPGIAIDMTLWEQPEDAASGDDREEESSGRNPESVPLIDVDRAVVLIDGPVDDDEELDENAPLLSGAGGLSSFGSTSGGGGHCSDDADSGIGGLGIPLYMPRRSSSHIGISLENGDAHGDMESSIASFLRSKSESENLASSATTNSPEEPEDQLENEVQKRSEGELREVASQIVNEVISQAQVQATKSDKVDNQRISDPHSDERLMEVVRRFVSDIMAAAKAEAWDSMRQIQNNNNNVLSLKDEAAVAATAAAGGGSAGVQNLASPGSAFAERLFRGRPWYVQMGRVFSAFLSRVCPCRCPTKP